MEIYIIFWATFFHLHASMKLIDFFGFVSLAVFLVDVFIFTDMRMSTSMYEIMNWGYGCTTPTDNSISSFPTNTDPTGVTANIGIEMP